MTRTNCITQNGICTNTGIVYGNYTFSHECYYNSSQSGEQYVPDKYCLENGAHVNKPSNEEECHESCTMHCTSYWKHSPCTVISCLD